MKKILRELNEIEHDLECWYVYNLNTRKVVDISYELQDVPQ